MLNEILQKEPIYVKKGIPFYGSEKEGDQFRDEDIKAWTTGGHFKRRWRDRGMTNDFRNAVYMDLCKKAADLNLPIMDIACGPNLGLLPDIYYFNKNIKAVAVDGCPTLVEKWREFFDEYAPETDVSFISCNVADMPIKDNAIDVMTSNIGFGSLRYAGANNMKGINEAYRVLKPGGLVFTVENEFEDRAVVQRIFDLWGKENWFKHDDLTWHERFEQAGLTIEQEEFLYTSTSKGGEQNWELAEKATQFGLEIVQNSHAYVLRKSS